MKTPREILLQKHQRTEFKLDGIRQTVVANLAVQQTQSEHSLFIAIVLKSWRELIWPARRIWAGLAAVWVFIVIANLNLSEAKPATMAQGAKPAADMFLALREQERVLAELVGKTEMQVAEPPKRSVPQPRSERKLVQLIG